MGWFDRQVRDSFGIDVFATPFPKKDGYAIYEGRRVRLLVLRTRESGCVCHRGLARHSSTFLTSSQPRANVGEDKDYKDIYLRFKQDVVLPESYLEQEYGSRFARHFYTDEELLRFKQQWQRQASREQARRASGDTPGKRFSRSDTDGSRTAVIVQHRSVNRVADCVPFDERRHFGPPTGRSGQRTPATAREGSSLLGTQRSHAAPRCRVAGVGGRRTTPPGPRPVLWGLVPPAGLDPSHPRFVSLHGPTLNHAKISQGLFGDQGETGVIRKARVWPLCRPGADDLAAVVDGGGGSERPTGARGVEQGLELEHAAVPPEDEPAGADVPGARDARGALARGPGRAC